MRIQQLVCNTFLPVRNSLAFQNPNVSTTPKHATALAEFNGDISSSDNRHLLRLLLEIEKVIQVDASDPPGISASLSYPWPDHRNGVLGCTGKEGEGWREFVKQGRKKENIIHLRHKDMYLPQPP